MSGWSTPCSPLNSIFANNTISLLWLSLQLNKRERERERRILYSFYHISLISNNWFNLICFSLISLFSHSLTYKVHTWKMLHIRLGNIFFYSFAYNFQLLQKNKKVEMFECCVLMHDLTFISFWGKYRWNQR